MRRLKKARTRRLEREYDFAGATRGPAVAVAAGKTRITIRVDGDVLTWFREEVHRAGGGNYQTLMNAALRTHMERSRGETLEQTLRRVLREEMPRRRGK
jgi:uncharacterized protein (DUF4415 family)